MMSPSRTTGLRSNLSLASSSSDCLADSLHPPSPGLVRSAHPPSLPVRSSSSSKSRSSKVYYRSELRSTSTGDHLARGPIRSAAAFVRCQETPGFRSRCSPLTNTSTARLDTRMNAAQGALTQQALAQAHKTSVRTSDPTAPSKIVGAKNEGPPESRLRVVRTCDLAVQ